MQLRTLVLALAGAGLIAACGGGGSGDSSSTPPAGGGGGGGGGGGSGGSSVTLTGVAAHGAAFAGATVTAKCATGSGSTTTATSGAYSLSIGGGALPCVLQAASSDGATTLHSVVASAGAGGSTTVNITPLTELLVAQLAAGDPTGFMAAATPTSLASAVTPGALTSAQTAVAATLAAAGIDTQAIGDFVGGLLVAASTGVSGNGYDATLDQLAAALSQAGSTLPELTTTVAVAAAGGAPDSGASDSTQPHWLPAELLLKPHAANCDALRSTTYRLVVVQPSVTTGGNDAVTTTDSVSFDATTLTATFASDGSSSTWTANGNCRYSTPDGADVVVSPAGVIVARAQVGADDTSTSDPGKLRLAIALPQQSATLADLAGTWNFLGWMPGSSGFGIGAGTFVANADGSWSSVRCDSDSLATADAACTTTSTQVPRFAVDAAGGFDIRSTNPSDVWSSRAFAYRAGNGEWMLLVIAASGEVDLATRYRSLALPAVGDVTSQWNLTVNAANVAVDAVAGVTHTIASIDAAIGGYTRATQNAGSSVTVPQTFAVNDGRNGYQHRVAASVTASDGSPAAVRELYALKLGGMGLSAYYLPNSSTGSGSNARFGLSVRQP